MSRLANKLFSTGGGVDAYEIDQSLMFNAADTAYLKRTPSSAGNRRTFTLSAWVKMTSVGSNNGAIFCCSTGTNDASTTYIAIYQGTFQFQGYNTNYRKSNRLLRDVGAWYHLVYAIDTTQGTADNRIRMYINGEEITSWHTKNNPSQNYDFIINSTNEHQLGDEGGQTGGITPWDGYMAEVNFIDGAQLTPSSFGETDSATGQWIPKEITGLTYGTNGFYLPFKNSSKSSAYFDGTNSALTTADHSDFEFGTNNWTIECWAMADYTDTNNRYLCGQAAANGADASASFQIQMTGSTRKISAYVFNGGYQGVGGTIAITAGKWFHVALVRNGNTLSLYVDGVLSGSNVTWNQTMNNSSSSVSVGRYGDCTANWHYSWKGWISDFRIVNGTAVYTSAFTPPTTSLTAITNTKLLCCNNATVTTESSGTSKTLTITTANSVYSALLSPFEFNYFSDQSGQENDFIGTNLLTSDVLLDTPTNNFATYNSLDSGSTITLSQGSLSSSGSGWADVRSTIKVPHTGKWYVELLVTTQGNTYFGLYSDDYTDTDAGQGYGTAKHLVHHGGISGGSSGGYISGGFASGDIISMAVDCDNGKLWWAKNGTYPSSGNPATGANQALTFTATDNYNINMAGASGNVTNINFGQNGTFAGTKTAQGNADGNGYGNFYYAPPSGFNALCTQNLATPGIKKSTENFNTILYTGSDDGAVSQSVTGVGHQPDLVWIKKRSGTAHHVLTDSVRGATKALNTNQNVVEVDDTYGVTAFGSDGFTVREQASAGGQVNTGTLVSWNWKANGSGSSNTDGSINTISTSVNTTAGISISTYTGTGSNATVGHGLGAVPATMWIKNRDTNDNWRIYSNEDPTDYMAFNWTGASTDDNTSWNDTAPTSSVFSIGTDTNTNRSGDKFIAYCFAEVEGFSKFGTYRGNGESENGPFIHTGFTPALVIVKKSSAAGSSWLMWDSKRHPENVIDLAVWVDASNGDTSHAEYEIDYLSNGFKIRGQNAGSNASGATHIYMAFAEAPFKYATAR